MMLAPHFWIMALQLDVGIGGKEYFILIGAGLVVIGFCLIVLARNKASQTPNAGPILGTVFDRVVIVNGFLIRFYTQGIINARFTLLFSILDSSLSFITYGIWARDNKHGSLVQFFKDIWSTLNPVAQKQPRFLVFQALGLVQLIMSLAAPSVIMSKGIVPDHDIQGSHTLGLFRATFAMYTLHALIHIFAVGSQNDSFPIASVLYRLTWNIPVLLVLGYVSQVPVGLIKLLVIYDMVFVGLTILIFARGNHVKTK